MEETADVAPESRAMSGFQRVWSVYFDPSKAFADIAQRPSWMVPLVVLIVVAIFTSVLSGPMRIQEAVDRIDQNPRLTAQQKEEIRETIEDRSGRPVMKLLSYLIGPVVGVFIYILAVSAVLYFGGNVLMGGDAPFKRVLSVFSYSSLVAIPASIIKVPLMLVKKSVNVQTSLAALMPSGSDDSVAFKILAKFDIFTIWQIALVALGLAIVYKFTVKKSASMVIGFWGLWIIISVGLSTLFKGRFMM